MYRIDTWKKVTEGVVRGEKFEDLDVEKLNEISEQNCINSTAHEKPQCTT